MQSFVTGSVSRYCLQNSPVPCIVVRPTRKRIAKKAKRLADEKRRNYQNVLELSGARGSQVLNSRNGSEMDKLLVDSMAGTAEATEKEARAVAEAIGIPKSLRDSPGLRRPTPAPDDEGAPLARAQSARSGYTSSVGESPSPTGAFIVSEENSPEIEPLELSDDEEEEDDVAAVRAEETKEELARGRTMSQGSGQQRTGAKTFVFPEKRRKSAGG